MAFCGFFKADVPTLQSQLRDLVQKREEFEKEYERGVEVGAKETIKILEEAGIVRTAKPEEEKPAPVTGKPEMIRIEPVPDTASGYQPTIAAMYGVSTPGSAANKIAFPETTPRQGNGAGTIIPGVTTAGYSFPELHPFWYGLLGFGIVWIFSKSG